MSDQQPVQQGTASEEQMREMFIRVLRDGGGKVLPSEAARLVAPLFGVSPVEVILSFGAHRANQEAASAR